MKPRKLSAREKILSMQLRKEDEERYSEEEIEQGLRAFVAWHREKAALGIPSEVVKYWVSEYLECRSLSHLDERPPVIYDSSQSPLAWVNL